MNFPDHRTHTVNIVRAPRRNDGEPHLLRFVVITLDQLLLFAQSKAACELQCEQLADVLHRVAPDLQTAHETRRETA